MTNKKFIKIFSYVVLGIIGFVLIVKIGNYIKIVNSEAYTLAKKYIETNQNLIEKTGEIQEFGKFPSGSIGYKNGKTVAQIETRVIGAKSNGDVILLMEKQPNKDWEYKKIFFNKDD